MIIDASPWLGCDINATGCAVSLRVRGNAARYVGHERGVPQPEGRHARPLQEMVSKHGSGIRTGVLQLQYLRRRACRVRRGEQGIRSCLQALGISTSAIQPQYASTKTDLHQLSQLTS